MYKRVAALYRYPVKGFAAETCEALSVRADGRIAGDRVLGLRFANAAIRDEAWGTKHEFVALVNTPGLARLNLDFNHETLRLRISLHGAVLVEETLDEAGRKRIASAVAEYVLKLDENPLSSHPERLPLRVIGDGATPRYQDNPAGQVTLHGRQSLAAVAAASGAPDLSEHRFRSNIAVDGLEAWEEQNWLGRTVCIGEVRFKVMSAKTRCLATHANPLTGARDLLIMKTLTNVFPREKPTFAIAMIAHDRGGIIRVGDTVTLLQD